MHELQQNHAAEALRIAQQTGARAGVAGRLLLLLVLLMLLLLLVLLVLLLLLLLLLAAASTRLCPHSFAQFERLLERPPTQWFAGTEGPSIADFG